MRLSNNNKMGKYMFQKIGTGNANIYPYLCCQRNNEGFCLFFIQQLTFKAIPHGIYDPLQEKTFLFEETNGNNV